MQYPVDPFVVSGEGVLTPRDRDRWVPREMYVDAGEKPVYTVIEVAHVFFGKSPIWLRKRLWEFQAFDDTTPRTGAGHRRFGLYQIEDLAHILLEQAKISPLQFAMTIRIIKSSAILHGYEIGDTGFLLEYWVAASVERKEAVSLIMDRLAHQEIKQQLRHADPEMDHLIRTGAHTLGELEHHLRDGAA